MNRRSIFGVFGACVGLGALSGCAFNDADARSGAAPSQLAPTVVERPSDSPEGTASSSVASPTSELGPAVGVSADEGGPAACPPGTIPVCGVYSIDLGEGAPRSSDQCGGLIDFTFGPTWFTWLSPVGQKLDAIVVKGGDKHRTYTYAPAIAGDANPRTAPSLATGALTQLRSVQACAKPDLADGRTGVCNALPDVGASVDDVHLPSASLSFAGGAIADGTYVLQHVTHHTAWAVPTQAWGSETLRIVGGAIEQVATPAGLAERRFAGSLTATGNLLLPSTKTCSTGAVSLPWNAIYPGFPGQGDSLAFETTPSTLKVAWGGTYVPATGLLTDPVVFEYAKVP